jgi:glutathione reductase (NADPH)
MASARRAAGYGAKVAVIERTVLGGTCVNVGCVPKKVMFNAATVSETLHDAHQFGFTVDGYKLDWLKLKNSRDAYIVRLNGIYKRLLENSKVTLYNGLGHFVSPNEVEVNGQLLTASHILIAVGGKPKMPSIPGIEHCINSDGFFALEKQPNSVAVIGGGYIGVELAGVFNGLGTKTSLFTRGSKPLRGFDELIVDSLLIEMKKQGLNYEPNQTPVEIIKNDDNTLTLVTETGKFGPYDQVLFATGREPLTKPLKLDAANIKTNSKGYIIVDEYQQTSTEYVYALGDVCGKVELTPTAIAAGRRLADRQYHHSFTA